ncbi:MAG: hypothetical protein MRJ96_02655 [Nitrospirales bacterium]|nr:hypothetical protein [Nitrospira sp.]MDR4500342.1 hypothetical protein [Nitrospirales bacterium]
MNETLTSNISHSRQSVLATPGKTNGTTSVSMSLLKSGQADRTAKNPTGGHELIFPLVCLTIGTGFSLFTWDWHWQAGVWGGAIGLAVGSCTTWVVRMLQRRSAFVSNQALQRWTLAVIMVLAFSCTLSLIFPGSERLVPALCLTSMLIFPYLFHSLSTPKGRIDTPTPSVPSSETVPHGLKILDTSTIIDGRVYDLCETEFFEGPLLVPTFVLGELQHIADSSQAWKRARGKRGLEVLAKLQQLPHLHVSIGEEDFPEISMVDEKLIRLAKIKHAKIVTNDWNLAKVASFQHIQTLNVNQLSYQLKPPVLPGEVIRVYINKEGDLAGQGVAHLDDGTMVVVDQAREHVKETIDVMIQKFMQTQSGRILFGSRV